MPNKMYTLGRAAFGNAGINWLTDTIKAALVTSSYTPNLATDQFWSTAVGNVIGTPIQITSPTNVGGKLSGANVSYGAAAGTATYIVIYKDTGTTTTSPLIGLIDGEENATCAANASTSATSITIDPLFTALASGTTVVFGAVTATLTAGASAGARTLTVSALSGSIAQGVVGVSSPQGGMPVNNAGGTTISWDSTNGILTL